MAPRRGLPRCRTFSPPRAWALPLIQRRSMKPVKRSYSNIEEEGFARWIATVRKHHSQTYQHCLIVTGVAVTFAQDLGFSKTDRHRVATAGLLHDVGKARIPLSILEKPGPLNDDELAIMRKHPLLGYDALN